MNLKQRALNWLIALDQFLFCTVCLGQSYPNETASAAAWRLDRDGHWAGRLFRPVIDFFFFLDPHHCERSFHNMMRGEFMPPDLDTKKGPDHG